jgi:serine/threonine-protein kinase RsbW
MDKRSALAMSVEASTDPASLEKVHALLQRFWSRGPDVDEVWRMMFETAVAEIAANILEHSRRDRGARMLRLSLTAFGDRVEAWLQDDGLGVDVSLDTPLPLESAQRGRGLALVKSMVDEFSYARSDDMNRWLIVKRLPGHA